MQHNNPMVLCRAALLLAFRRLQLMSRTSQCTKQWCLQRTLDVALSLVFTFEGGSCFGSEMGWALIR